MKYKLISCVVAFLRLFPKGMIIFFYDLIKPFSQPFFTGIRYCIFKRLCKSVGKKVIIGSNVTVKHWQGIAIGDNVSIHDFSYIDAYGGIVIGNEVSIAHNCTLISSHHTWGIPEVAIRMNPIEKRAITLGSNIWLGCAVRILGGAVLEDNVIVGAGTIVSKKLEENGIYFGSPVRLHKRLYDTLEERSTEVQEKL